MGLAQRVGRLEKKVTTVLGHASARGTVVILRSWLHGPAATLIGYQAGSRDHPANQWLLDPDQWPQVPADTIRVIEEVWSDHAEGASPVLVSDTPDTPYEGTIINHFTLTREEVETLHLDTTTGSKTQRVR